MPPEFREWGDGANDRRVHVIEDISYTGGYIICRCGATLAGRYPEVLADAWTRHGGAVLRMSNVAERGREPELPHRQRQTVALAAIVQLGRQCNCNPYSDVQTCLNYRPGDEEGTYDDTDTE